MLLAIDTSAGTSVAIVDGAAGVCVERSVDDSRRHAEVIGELMAECLEAAKATIGGSGEPDSEATDPQSAPLTGVAVGMGPGPFTGLRVGIAAATAFAIGARLPLLRVVSHDAMAFGHYWSGAHGPLLVTTDARRHERYWSAYSGVDRDGLPLRSSGPGLGRAETIVEAATGADSGLYGYERLDVEWPRAASVGMLAELLSSLGRDFASAEPLYLRSPDVTLAAAPKRVTS